MVTGYGNDPGRTKSVAEEDAVGLLVPEAGEVDDREDRVGVGLAMALALGLLRRSDLRARVGCVQICTRKRVCAHVQRTWASVSRVPPLASAAELSVVLPLRGARVSRKMERSKYV
jgi:hypothetical protein